MTAPKKNPSFPDSLAADGNRGAGAGHCKARKVKHSPDQWARLLSARLAVRAASESLDRYAHATDQPSPDAVDAADALGAAADALTRAAHP